MRWKVAAAVAAAVVLASSAGPRARRTEAQAPVPAQYVAGWSEAACRDHDRDPVEAPRPTPARP